MRENALKYIIFISVFYNFFSFVISHKCFSDNIICIEKVREAVINYPKDQKYLLCEMKTAFTKRNHENPLYTDCVNLARDKFAGRMRRGGVINSINNFKMVVAIRKKQFRKALSACIDLLSDCYDVNNLKLCLSRHEEL